jgi:hypothetical protein
VKVIASNTCTEVECIVSSVSWWPNQRANTTYDGLTHHVVSIPRRYARSLWSKLLTLAVVFIALLSGGAFGGYIGTLFGLSEDGKMYVMLDCSVVIPFGCGLAGERF